MHELGNSNFAVHLENLYRAGVVLTPDHRLTEVSPSGNRLLASLRNEYTGAMVERLVDHVVVEHGTLPMDVLYATLKADSLNLGEVDVDVLADARTVMPERNSDGKWWLLRVGDAVASRNIHAAIYDALRACKDL